MELLRNVTFGQFISSDSVIHRLDPRVKVGLLAIGMTVCLQCRHLVPLALVAIACVGAAVAAGLSARYYLTGLRTIGVLLIFTVCFNAFYVHGGAPLMRVGQLTLDTEGLHFALLMASRLLLLFLMTSLFTLTTSPLRLTDALESILSPLRYVGVRTAELSMMVSIALRFVPTLVDHTEKILKAQVSRGARFDEGNVLSRTRAMVPVLVPLFVQAFRAADALAEAMEARCYRGGAGRTRLVTLRVGPPDVAAVLLVGALAIGVVHIDALPWRGWT